MFGLCRRPKRFRLVNFTKRGEPGGCSFLSTVSEVLFLPSRSNLFIFAEGILRRVAIWVREIVEVDVLIMKIGA